MTSLSESSEQPCIAPMYDAPIGPQLPPTGPPKTVCSRDGCTVECSAYCKACMAVAYCSRDHQKEDWKERHGAECKYTLPELLDFSPLKTAVPVDIENLRRAFTRALLVADKSSRTQLAAVIFGGCHTDSEGRLIVHVQDTGMALESGLSAGTQMVNSLAWPDFLAVRQLFVGKSFVLTVAFIALVEQISHSGFALVFGDRRVSAYEICIYSPKGKTRDIGIVSDGTDEVFCGEDIATLVKFTLVPVVHDQDSAETFAFCDLAAAQSRHQLFDVPVTSTVPWWADIKRALTEQEISAVDMGNMQRAMARDLLVRTLRVLGIEVDKAAKDERAPDSEPDTNEPADTPNDSTEEPAEAAAPAPPKSPRDKE